MNTYIYEWNAKINFFVFLIFLLTSWMLIYNFYKRILINIVWDRSKKEKKKEEKVICIWNIFLLEGEKNNVLCNKNYNN